ncbi:glycosyltransferase [Terriglobus albidus]|uniref:Glycosyltransferase n=1 Tax=Terriglobus albidus TaxID=1592106 RepID=A0A5B9EEJ1_9BACT|nr:glycosyltransferase [Terriglobus albidus]QEE29535.1 glycosyltransferase [Terriglobus albidus]
MRILHIIRTINPEAGGPAEAVRTLISYKDLGYEGEVLTQDDPNAPYLKGLPFPVHALGPVNSTYGYTSKLIPWLKKNRSRFDGAVVNGLWNYGGLAAYRALFGEIPYLVFPHGMLDPYFKSAYPLKHLKKLAYWLSAEYRVLKGANYVLFTSQAEKELAEKTFPIYRWTPHIVPYGADTPRIQKAEALRAFYDHAPELRGKRFLLFLGRIHPKKGVDLMLQAFAQTAALDPELHLVIAGPDQVGWRHELQTIVDKAGLTSRVHWPGMLKGALKWGAFYACEAFILPSHQENFGIAVAEALACGKPVLLSDQVNIAPDIKADSVGLVEADTLDGTLNLFRRWNALSADERTQMYKQAPITFRTRYDMKENAKIILGLFGKELKKHPLNNSES